MKSRFHLNKGRFTPNTNSRFRISIFNIKNKCFDMLSKSYIFTDNKNVKSIQAINYKQEIAELTLKLENNNKL